MNETKTKRPKQKAIRSQQFILGWLLLWVVIGLGLQYSAYLQYRDMGGFHIGVVFLSGIGRKTGCRYCSPCLTAALAEE